MYGVFGNGTGGFHLNNRMGGGPVVLRGSTVCVVAGGDGETYEYGRYAVRALTRPGGESVVILSLALGIGANGHFSLMHQALLHLPVPSRRNWFVTSPADFKTGAVRRTIRADGNRSSVIRCSGS